MGTIFKLVIIAAGVILILTGSTAVSGSYRSYGGGAKYHGGYKYYSGYQASGGYRYKYIFNPTGLFHHPRKVHSINPVYGSQLYGMGYQTDFGHPYKRKYYRNKIKHYNPYWYGFGAKNQLEQGYGDYQFDNFNPRENWAAADYGVMPFNAVIADYDGYGRPVYHCKARYQQKTHYGRAVGQYCYIDYYQRQVTVRRYQVRVNR